MTQYAILLYHGVHDDHLEAGLCNRSGKHISQSRFRSEMEYLSENVPLVSMLDIALAHQGHMALPDHAVAVTFDDGFLNNYLTAWPVLEEFRIPATFYLATGFIGTDRMIWSDRLEQALLTSENSKLQIESGPHKLLYDLAGDEKRIEAFMQIKAFCKTLPNHEKDQIVQDIESAMTFDQKADHPLYAFINWSQVLEMNRSPLISFGAHTVDHVSLGKVPTALMQSQIDQSVDHLAQELNEKVSLFSYPEGQHQDFNPAVIAHLQMKGFDHCPTAIAGYNNTETTSPFEIRRIMVGFEGRPFPFAIL